MFATVALAPTAALIAGSALSRLYTWPELRRTRTELADARRLAEYDPLTGLPNRAGAHRRHRQEIAAGRPPAAVLLDLDGFKAVNDTWGHPAGDAHLAEIAERLAESCAPIGALASRLAGDEFLLLMPHSGEHTVLAHVRAILARLGMPLPLPTSSGATIAWRTSSW